jgi:hypothetical protein
MLFFLTPLLIILNWGGQLGAAASQDSPRLYVIERDTLQTRNFTPIINHQTMAVNLGDQPLEMELISPIPAAKDKEGKFYPAFLEESLLPTPLFSPLEVTPKKVIYLGRPEIKKAGQGSEFVWKKVNLPGKEAVVAQYDNYLGEPDFFWRPQGLEIFGLKLHTRYEVERLDASRWRLSMRYELVNDTGSVLKDLGIEVFIPLWCQREGKEMTLLEVEEISTSPNVDHTRFTKVDGFGQAATGLGMNWRTEELQPGAQAVFFLKLTGLQATQKGSLWPIITLEGRSLQPPVWPATIIRAAKPLREGRFAYLSYNLVLQDSRAFRFSPMGVQPIQAPPKGGDPDE